MRAVIAMFLLAVERLSFRMAARLLPRGDSLTRLDAGAQRTFDVLSRNVSASAAEMLRIIRGAHGAAGDAARMSRVTVSVPAAPDQPQIIVFDLVDGSHCYYIDPPGVCCCGRC